MPKKKQERLSSFDQAMLLEDYEGAAKVMRRNLKNVRTRCRSILDIMKPYTEDSIETEQLYQDGLNILALLEEIVRRAGESEIIGDAAFVTYVKEQGPEIVAWLQRAGEYARDEGI